MKLHLRRYYRILQNKFEKKILFTFNYLWYILSMIEFALITLVLYNTQVWWKDLESSHLHLKSTYAKLSFEYILFLHFRYQATIVFPGLSKRLRVEQ